MTETEPLPKWMMRKYALLYNEVGEKKFTTDNAIKLMKEDKQIILVLLSRLRKAGWLEVYMNEKDARRKLYSLKPIHEILKRMQE